jgi:hypothetical protein
MFYNYSNNIDYDTKYKICIAVSGETRNFNTTTHAQLAKFKSKLEALNFEVYIVAHTWTHSAVPQHTHLFNEIKFEDQADIDRWVLSHYALRAPLRHDSPLLDIRNPADVKVKMMEARRSYGQLWGAFSSFKMFSTSDNIPGCDLLIRWRWDLGIDNYVINGIRISDDDMKIVQNYNFEYLNVSMRRMAAEGANMRPIGATDGTGGITANSNGIDTRNFVLPTLNDRFIIFNLSAAGILSTSNFTEVFDNILRVGTRVENFDGHTLWYTVLLNMGISMCIDIPQMTNLMRET